MSLKIPITSIEACNLKFDTIFKKDLTFLTCDKCWNVGPCLLVSLTTLPLSLQIPSFFDKANVSNETDLIFSHNLSLMFYIFCERYLILMIGHLRKKGYKDYDTQLSSRK